MRITPVFTVCGILLVSLFAPAMTLAQSLQSQSDSHTLFHHFDQLYRADSRLVSGDFYQDLSPSSTDGHPFSGEPDWCIGTVVTGHVSFDSLLLRYDICRNELVCNTAGMTTHHLPIALNKIPISSFTLGTRSFRPYPDPNRDQDIRFCEVLSDGPVTLLLLESKQLKVPMGGNSTYSYETFSRMKLLINDKLIDYSGKRTLFHLYPALKIALREFIRSSRLKLMGYHPENHARLVNYCNSLLSQTE
jgi:hypothetical protein